MKNSKAIMKYTERKLHEISPSHLKNDRLTCVMWVPADQVGRMTITPNKPLLRRNETIGVIDTRRWLHAAYSCMGAK